MCKGRKLSQLLNNPKTVTIAVAVGIAAILLIFLSSVVDFHSDESIDAQAYAAKTEKRLLQIVTQIDGAGETQIFLTMDNSGENVYLKNSDTKTISIEPKVRGVVVVCEGGDDPTVVSRVLDAVTKSLNISSDKVCITK